MYLTSGFAAQKMSIPFYLLNELKKVEGNIKYSVQEIYSHIKDVYDKAALFQKTGGVHSGGLYYNRKLVFFCEDIGRHNVISKLVGYGLINNVDLSKCIIVSSGRISSEIALKIARAGIQILATSSCPTDIAVKIADQAGVTLVGFARGNECTVYTGAHRIAD
jgi:FdhD protein